MRRRNPMQMAVADMHQLVHDLRVEANAAKQSVHKVANQLADRFGDNDSVTKAADRAVNKLSDAEEALYDLEDML